MTCRVEMVVAAAENNVIGHDGDMPWRLPSDLRHFKKTTLGHAVVMGRKTWQSIGRPLPDRQNIVISRMADFAAQGAEVVSDPQQALDLVTGQRAMIIGGGEIYKLFEKRAEIIHLTRVHATPQGDTVFHLAAPDEWVEVSRAYHAAGEGDSADYSFIELRRKTAT